MTEVSELKLKLVGMEGTEGAGGEAEKAEVSVINHPYCPKLRSGEAIRNVASGHLVNPKPDSHWVPETSMHQRLSDLLYQVIRFCCGCRFQQCPKPPHFGSRLYPTSGCWQGWKGADKTQRGIRGLLWEMTMCWDSHCHCSWVWRHPLICISVTQLQPLDFVFLFSWWLLWVSLYTGFLLENVSCDLFWFCFLRLHMPLIGASTFCVSLPTSLSIRILYILRCGIVRCDRRVAFRFRNALAQLTDLTD